MIHRYVGARLAVDGGGLEVMTIPALEDVDFGVVDFGVDVVV